MPELSRSNIAYLNEEIAHLMAHGFRDDEIASHLMAIGGSAHLQFGRLVKMEDLVALVRDHLTRQSEALNGSTNR